MGRRGRTRIQDFSRAHPPISVQPLGRLLLGLPCILLSVGRTGFLGDHVHLSHATRVVASATPVGYRTSRAVSLQQVPPGCRLPQETVEDRARVLVRLSGPWCLHWLLRLPWMPLWVRQVSSFHTPHSSLLSVPLTQGSLSPKMYKYVLCYIFCCICIIV